MGLGESWERRSSYSELSTEFTRYGNAEKDLGKVIYKILGAGIVTGALVALGLCNSLQTGKEETQIALYTSPTMWLRARVSPNEYSYG